MRETVAVVVAGLILLGTISLLNEPEAVITRAERIARSQYDISEAQVVFVSNKVGFLLTHTDGSKSTAKCPGDILDIVVFHDRVCE